MYLSTSDIINIAANENSNAFCIKHENKKTTSNENMKEKLKILTNTKSKKYHILQKDWEDISQKKGIIFNWSKAIEKKENNYQNICNNIKFNQPKEDTLLQYINEFEKKMSITPSNEAINVYKHFDAKDLSKYNDKVFVNNSVELKTEYNIDDGYSINKLNNFKYSEIIKNNNNNNNSPGLYVLCLNVQHPYIKRVVDSLFGFLR